MQSVGNRSVVMRDLSSVRGSQWPISNRREMRIHLKTFGTVHCTYVRAGMNVHAFMNELDQKDC